MSKGPFVSLHNHTELGSPLDGMNDTYDLFKRAKEIDHPAVAVTDHGTMTALYDAWKASKETGVKLIPGMEAYFTDDLTKRKNYHLVLLAKNEAGYRTLLRLNYEAYRNQVSGYMGKKTPRISWEHVEQFNEGIIALTACSNGLVAKTLITEQDEALAECHLKRLNSIFKDNFFLEIQPHDLYAVGKNGKEVNQRKLNEAMIKYSNDMGIPYVITCDAHYRDKDHAKYHDFMLAIKDKKPVDDPNRFRYGVQDMYLKTHEEITDFFGNDIAEVGMANTIKIMESCEEPTYLEPQGALLPKFPVQSEDDYPEFKLWHRKHGKEIEEDKSYLRYQCLKGFKDKFGDLNNEEKRERWDRVKKELSVLEEKDFSSYMLIVSDYINWAKDQGMPVGPARGSAAGSLVAYLTGITSVNPIEYGLIFERFHNNQKQSFPDIDTDFAKGSPAKVRDYLKSKYGEANVASISNWSTLSPKVIIKDVARSLQLGGDKSTAFKIANHITAIMPDAKTIEDAMKISRDFAAYMDKYPELYEYASKLQGLTRNWSVHAAGVVISDRPLYEIAPLRIDYDSGMIVTQWEKNRCEENGLIKHDLLGVKTLNVIDDTLRTIEATTGEIITIDDIPLDDEETFKMISRGETSGVFQLESSLTPLCMRIKPKNIETISDINALGRPSCSPEQRKTYINRRFGKEKVKFVHPSLKGALEKTYGVSLYEEGMMYIAGDCAGWDLNQADALRKITKLKGKDPELVTRTQSGFVKDCMSKWDMPYEVALDIWENEIEPFGLYGFNKSHSVSYSHISYYTAWLRRHHPTEFMCSLLNSEDPNSDAAQEYLSECKRMGIEIMPPEVKFSGGNYVVLNQDKIVTGLSAVKGVGDAAIMQIVAAQPFDNLASFFANTEGRVVNKRIIQALAKAGAFDSFDIARKDIFENYAKYRTKVQNAIKKDKPIEDLDFSGYDEEWTRKEVLLGEKEILGRTISGSLHEVFEGYFRKDSNIVTLLNTVKDKNSGTKVKIEVIINSKLKEFKIKRGKNIGRKFAKYLVEDVYGNTSELTVWTDDYERYRDYLKDGTPIKAICRVSEYMEQKGLSLSVLENVFGRRL
jgi:DNA polymerase-3 subunit alpha